MKTIKLPYSPSITKEYIMDLRTEQTTRVESQRVNNNKVNFAKFADINID